MTKTDVFDDFLQQALDKRSDAGLLRKLIFTDGTSRFFREGMVDFASNDYLGFAQNPCFETDLPTHLPLHGSTGSRLISGNSALAEQTEDLIAHFHRAEAALIFNTGYMANVGLFSSIGDADSVFIYDEYVHASVHDGMRLSRAQRVKFKHNDLLDLAEKLKYTDGTSRNSREGSKKYVAVESIYSMDGDIAPLSEIAEICQTHNAALIVDEAHGTGVLGHKGEGLVNDLGLESLVWARVHTFGKALGGHGAAVVGSRLLRDFLINHARSFIYTTALPPLAYHHIQKAYQLLPFADRHKLTELVAYFIQKTRKITLSEGHFVCNPSSPIQGIVIPDNQKIVQLAQRLYDKGIYAKAILSPTVPRGMERIRICLHSFNTFNEIDKLLRVIL